MIGKATGLHGLSQRARFQRDGYLITTAMVPDDAIAAMSVEAARVADAGLLVVRFPHEQSPLFHAILGHPAITALLTKLIGFRDIVMVAGEDPCGWTCITGLSRPFVRWQGPR
jgi:hypothetical protein